MRSRSRYCSPSTVSRGDRKCTDASFPLKRLALSKTIVFDILSHFEFTQT